MKMPLVFFGMICAATTLFAQGTLNFANFATGVNAPITNALNTPMLAGPFVADLFWSNTTNAPTDSLTAAGFNQPFSTLTLGGGGYFLGGAHTVNGASGAIEAQVRVWDFSQFPTFQAALVAGDAVGWSKPFVMFLALPPSPASPMVGLQGFTLYLPEPSGFCLAMLGSVVLLFRRKPNPKAVNKTASATNPPS